MDRAKMHLMNMKELQEFLKVKRSTVYRLRDEGLPVIRLGRVVRFDREEIVRWLRSRQVSEVTAAPDQRTRVPIPASVSVEEPRLASRIDDDEIIL